MTKTAHIYIRFSTLEQREGTSTRRQKDDCLRHIESKGWKLGEVLIDEGRSAFSGDNRTEGAALAIFENEASMGLHHGSILLVERLDRLSQQGLEDTFDLIRHFGRHGVHVATVDGDTFYEAGARLDLVQVITMLVKAETAREESEKKSERLKRRYEIRRNDAETMKRPMSRTCPAWLVVEDGVYNIDKAKAKVVREIWGMADSGMGAHSIARKLNREGVETWGRWGRKAAVWDRARISKILNDPAVIGEYQPHIMRDGKRVKHGEPFKLFPVIVEPELFARVRATAKTRLETKGGGRSAVVVNLVSGLARCSECGGKMEYKRIKPAGSTYVAKSGNVLTHKRDVAALVCRNAANHGKCPNRSQLTYMGFEDALLDSLLPLAMDDKAFLRRDEVAQLNGLIAEKTREAEHAKVRAERLWLAFANDGNGPSAMAQRLAEGAEAEANDCEAAIAELHKQREKAMGKASGEEHLSRIASIRQHLYDEDLEVRAVHRRKVMEAIRSVCERVTCFPSREVRVSLINGTRMISIKPGMGRSPAKISHLDMVHPTREYPGDSLVGQELRRRIKEARVGR
ncbi:recombinase family protein [Novosphingobium sp. MBES04]|uniref:recombinase family protein n=1 Tax=Novosphingobium sp. MBES04 TaxID=1206458 RepID=UPI000580705B|nr:recombinase family protein [Novosphingobium sp. MBES04]